ncbi:MAG: HAD hydrolase-like protein, partial [Desulfobacterales bacterium]|nr:HAD hydrolase-like protein [Desulfobacterales bacterium]
RSCAEKLNNVGFNIYESEVITASFATAKYLRNVNPRSCWVMLKGEGLEEFYVFEMALKTMDIEKGKALMVGDKITTDVVGAKKAGIRSALVKKGELKESDLDCDIKPDYIFDSTQDIKKLFE